MLKGWAVRGDSKRCDGTTWMMSPAAIYSLAADTIAMYPSRVMLDVMEESLATAAAPSSRGGTAGPLSRWIISSIFASAERYAARVDGNSSTGTLAMILSVWRTLSNISIVSVNIM